MIHRIANFFLILGAILMLLFILTDTNHTPYFGYLIFGTISLLFGGALHWTAPSPPREPSERFRVLKRYKKNDSDHDRS